MTFFDILNSLFYKTHIDYDEKICPAYLLSLWIAHDPELIDIADKVAFYQFKIPDKYIYKAYWHLIPKKKRFIKWIKKIKPSINDEIESIKDELQISTLEAKELYNYIKLLEEKNSAITHK